MGLNRFVKIYILCFIPGKQTTINWIINKQVYIFSNKTTQKNSQHLNIYKTFYKHTILTIFNFFPFTRKICLLSKSCLNLKNVMSAMIRDLLKFMFPFPLQMKRVYLKHFNWIYLTVSKIIIYLVKYTTLALSKEQITKTLELRLKQASDSASLNILWNYIRFTLNLAKSNTCKIWHIPSIVDLKSDYHCL